jgi:hypothetical protein
MRGRVRLGSARRGLTAGRLTGVAGRVALALCLVAGRAAAGNEDELLLGNDAALSAGAVTATVADGSALYYNPAGLARGERDSVDVTASAFVIRRYQLPQLLSAPTGERASGDFIEIVSAPTALSYVRRLSPRLAAGVAVFVPRSNDLVLRSTLRLEYGDRPTEWLAALGLTQSRYLATIGVGYRVSPRLDVGFSLHGIYDAGFLSSLFAGGFVSGVDPEQSESPADFTSDGFFQQQVLLNRVNLGVQPALGVQLEPSDHLRLGVSVRSPAIAVLSFQRGTSVTSQSGSDADLFLPIDERTTQWFPGRMLGLRAAAAVAYSWGPHWVAVDVDYQSQVHSSTLSLDLSSVVNARIGGRFQISDVLAVGCGLFTDRSNEPAPIDYTDTHIDFYGGTAGFELDHEYLLAQGQESSSLSFSSTVAVRYARGSGKVGGARADLAAPAPGEFAAITTPAGAASVDELSLHVGSAVYF